MKSDDGIEVLKISPGDGEVIKAEERHPSRSHTAVSLEIASPPGDLIPMLIRSAHLLRETSNGCARSTRRIDDCCDCKALSPSLRLETGSRTQVSYYRWKRYVAVVQRQLRETRA